MPDKLISDLHRRMLADMTIRSFSDKIRQNYIYHIQALSTFLGRSPDTATGGDLRRFQQHQVEQGAQPPKLNGQTSALRFLFTVTLGRPPAVRVSISRERARRVSRSARSASSRKSA
jgi:integrase/recombinase XerD